jgi:hypothetical protein
MTCDNPDLVDEMAFVLRDVGNLEDFEARFAAYYRANCDLFSANEKEQREADALALSIELMRRLAGHQ